jgi:hypothetical protein
MILAIVAIAAGYYVMKKKKLGAPLTVPSV